MSRINLNNYKHIINDNNYMGLKNNLSKDGIVPIYMNDKIYIYKVNSTNKSKELKDNYNSYLFDIYKTTIQPPKVDPLFYSNYLYYYGSILDFNVPTNEELENKFHFETKQEEFIKNNREIISLYDKESEKMMSRYENYEEIVSRIKKDYLTFTFKRPSKLGMTMNMCGDNNYISVDIISNIIYEFLYGKKLNINDSMFSCHQVYLKIMNLPFTNAEKKLGISDKLSTVKDIIDSFEIECIYIGMENEIPSYIFGLNINNEFKKNIYRIAKDNAYILFESEFKSTFDRLTKTKIYKK
ncbi:MAG: hypothetical protein J6G98_02530 [Bacilli bacterium]|nr:hypothetical protein [Bacilli bacterium]